MWWWLSVVGAQEAVVLYDQDSGTFGPHVAQAVADAGLFASVRSLDTGPFGPSISASDLQGATVVYVVESLSQCGCGPALVDWVDDGGALVTVMSGPTRFTGSFGTFDDYYALSYAQQPDAPANRVELRREVPAHPLWAGLRGVGVARAESDTRERAAPGAVVIGRWDGAAGVSVAATRPSGAGGVVSVAFAPQGRPSQGMSELFGRLGRYAWELSRSALTVQVTPSCPGDTSLLIDGGFPGGGYVVLEGAVVGSETLIGGPCPGLIVPITSPVVVQFGTFDGLGGSVAVVPENDPTRCATPKVVVDTTICTLVAVP